MIDHLKRYADKAAAAADPLIAAYLIDGEPDPSIAFWDRVGEVTGTTTDDDGNVGEVIEWLPYTYLWIALPEIDAALAPTCIVVAERETEQVLSSLIPQADWTKYRPETTVAGSNYPFGA